jgi:hypothetical protein
MRKVKGIKQVIVGENEKRCGTATQPTTKAAVYDAD